MKSCSCKNDLQNKIKFHSQLKGPWKAVTSFTVKERKRFQGSCIWKVVIRIHRKTNTPVLVWQLAAIYWLHLPRLVLPLREMKSWLPSYVLMHFINSSLLPMESCALPGVCGGSTECPSLSYEGPRETQSIRNKGERIGVHRASRHTGSRPSKYHILCLWLIISSIFSVFRTSHPCLALSNGSHNCLGLLRKCSVWPESHLSFLDSLSEVLSGI